MLNSALANYLIGDDTATGQRPKRKQNRGGREVESHVRTRGDFSEKDKMLNLSHLEKGQLNLMRMGRCSGAEKPHPLSQLIAPSGPGLSVGFETASSFAADSVGAAHLRLFLHF